MSSTPREIGTLIVVILKAKNLPNKRHIGKQDPYCSVSLNGETRRTKAIKRGGQHPEWDEEVRFTLFEDVEDVLARTANGEDTPPPPPPKDNSSPKKIKSGKSMRLTCYADDPREPEIIGETNVDLTEVLTKGETDEWFTLMYKEKYCGEVYLELTFWMNEKPPERNITPKPAKRNKQYGGPGSFAPLMSGDRASSLINGHPHPSSRIASTGSVRESLIRNDSIPSLRSSNSLAQLDLYVPPYEQTSRLSPIEQITNDFGEFGVSSHRRRESFPPPHGGYAARPPSSVGFGTLPSQPSLGFENGSYSDAGSVYSYEQPATTATLQHRNTISGQAYNTQSTFQPQYDVGSSTNYGSQFSMSRRPRYSVPTASSGFVPLPNPPSGFTNLQSHASEPSGFIPQSHTPAPVNYSQSHFTHTGYAPMPSQTPTPVEYMPTAPLPPPTPFQRQQVHPSQSFPYPQYAPPPSTPAPHQHYMTPQSSPSGLAPSHIVSHQGYGGYAPATPSPPQERTPPPPPQSNLISSGVSPNSRPLPQQPQLYGQPQPPPPISSQQQLSSYIPPSGSVGFPTANPLPPPPPPPLHQPIAPQSYFNGGQQVPPPPPPPPPSQFHSSSPGGHTGLPQPPIDYQQQSAPIPPPPPPDFSYSYPQSNSPSHYTSNQQPIPPPPPPPPPHISTKGNSYYQATPPRQASLEANWLPPNGYPQHAGAEAQSWN